MKLSNLFKSKEQKELEAYAQERDVIHEIIVKNYANEILPFVVCPNCNKLQKVSIDDVRVKMGKIGLETWLYRLDCDCGQVQCYSDYYDEFIWDK